MILNFYLSPIPLNQFTMDGFSFMELLLLGILAVALHFVLLRNIGVAQVVTIPVVRCELNPRYIYL